MARTFNRDLEQRLQDPKFVAYFAEAQIESAQELLRAGIINNLTISGMTLNKTLYWEIKWN